MKITSKLSINLKSALEKADEIWIATALLNIQGFEFIAKSIRKKCIVNFIGGIDLPTDPAALTKLLSLQTNNKHVVSAYIFNKKVYHPKVYIIRINNKIISFVGSANCTSGGFERNIEMTIEISDQVISKELLQWFNHIQQESQILTRTFISDYAKLYKKRIDRKKEDQKELFSFIKSEEAKSEANLKERDKLISKLIAIRKDSSYQEFKRRREKNIKDLKTALDYPNFVNIDLPLFWKIKDLGTIVPIRVKGKIEKNKVKFTKLMKYVCDDGIPLHNRLNEALNGEHSIANIGEGFLSKVLVIHSPTEYYVHNKEFAEIFKPFGLSFSRGLTTGDKYELTRDLLRDILKKTNIDNFAVLDQCLLRLAGKD